MKETIFRVSCNCGVFVAVTKLSPPTVGPNCRPPSVASSRGDRITSSVSGRVTPSAPYSIIERFHWSAWSHHTEYHSIGTEVKACPRSWKVAVSGPPCPGDSDYFGFSGFQIRWLDSQAIEFALWSQSNRVFPQSTIFSDTNFFSTDGGARSSDSPFTTPKAGVTKTPNPLNSSLVLPKSRASLNTPRPRIPSAVAMPPPASPARSTSFGSTCSPIGDPTQDDHVQGNRPSSSLDLIASGQALQSKINRLLGNATISDPNDVQPVSPPSQIQSTADANVVETYESTLSALNTRIETLQQEGTSLREMVSSLRSDLEQRQVVEKDRDSALAAVAEAEKETRAMERRLGEKDSRVKSLSAQMRSLLQNWNVPKRKLKQV
ncbi:hypothetical protein JVT61DRAFT_14175 [Boletus reticuloceps]|uniref:Uncharacterized protein n=1 Tax=Boletus reticuloceps TaxID=495285 RepID=A0A8I3A2T9_9AGAM|nr:hypothetical protein JVT61DRAFT_14175 [Boletus reticuloceps]